MALVNEYPIPNVVRVRATFRDSAGDLVAPSSVTAHSAAPDLAVTNETGNIVNDSTGKYHIDLTIDKVGIWRVTFVGDGARLETKFKGAPSVFQDI